MAHIEDRWFRSVPDPDNPKKKRKVPTERNGVGARYRVRWLGPDGQERSKAFPDGQLKAAQAWKAQQEVDLVRGTYVDPKPARSRSRRSRPVGSPISTLTSCRDSRWRCDSGAACFLTSVQPRSGR